MVMVAILIEAIMVTGMEMYNLMCVGSGIMVNVLLLSARGGIVAGRAMSRVRGANSTRL